MLCIETSNLTKKYGSSLAVDGISLEIKSGQVFGFLGPNGAGKSTVIKLLTTLMPPTKGKLSVLGIDAAKSPLEIRRKIGVVLQQPSYEMTLSVENSLDKYGMMWDVDKKTRKQRLNTGRQEWITRTANPAPGSLLRKNLQARRERVGRLSTQGDFQIFEYISEWI